MSDPLLMPRHFRTWAIKERFNLRRAESGDGFFYRGTNSVWQAWKERSALAGHAEHGAIRNQALQDASEVAFALAGLAVAQAIQSLKTPI